MQTFIHKTYILANRPVIRQNDKPLSHHRQHIYRQACVGRPAIQHTSPTNLHTYLAAPKKHASTSERMPPPAQHQHIISLLSSPGMYPVSCRIFCRVHLEGRSLKALRYPCLTNPHETTIVPSVAYIHVRYLVHNNASPHKPTQRCDARVLHAVPPEKKYKTNHGKTHLLCRSRTLLLHR